MYRNNDLYQDGVANEIFDVFRVKLGQSQMTRLYKKIGITNKKLLYVATQREQVLIDDFRAKQRTWGINQVVCIDETASNEKTGERKYGWAPAGMPAQQKQWLE